MIVLSFLTVMTKPAKTDPIIEVLTRGVTEVIIREELEKKMRTSKIRLYLGIDPTGTRLHLGHAIALRKLRDFQRLGHEVIFLVGSFTAMIGDTSDKDAMRTQLTHEQIQENFRTYKEQAAKILDFTKIQIKYNHEWLEKLKFEDILNLANKFTVQQMIEREMYQKRINEKKPIGLHEFLYPLMQGYDSVAMDVDLEVGGNDQLFNMLAGRTLQRVLKSRDKYVLTVELLEGTDGRKMAKTYNNVINITDTPNEQYGKIMSMKDELILKYFELCTDRTLAEIAEFKKELKDGINPRDLKMRLAREIVTMYYSAQKAENAEKEFTKIFQKKEDPTEVPLQKIDAKEMKLIDLLAYTKMAASKSEARRLVEGGGVELDHERKSDPNLLIDLTKERFIRAGKRKFLRVLCSK